MHIPFLPTIACIMLSPSARRLYHTSWLCRLFQGEVLPTYRVVGLQGSSLAYCVDSGSAWSLTMVLPLDDRGDRIEVRDRSCSGSEGARVDIRGRVRGSGGRREGWGI